MAKFNEREHRQKALEDARKSMVGMFDGLVLLGSWQNEDGNTEAVQACDGNWYACNGLADYFLTKRREGARLEAKNQHDEPDSDSGLV